MRSRIQYRGKHRPVLLGSRPTLFALPPEVWDTQQWRVYHSEWSIPSRRSFDGLEEVAEFVDDIVGSAFWREHLGFVEKVEVLPSADPHWSSGGVRAPLDSTGAIWIAEGMLNDLVILHELAHVVSPLYVGPATVTPGRLPGWSAVTGAAGHHGYFTGLNAHLVTQFSSDGHAGLLEDAYAHFDVFVEADVLSAVKHSRWNVEPLAKSWKEEFDREMDGLRAQRPVNQMPEVRPFRPMWGYWLRDYRRYLYGQSQSDLALALSRIERCTPADVGAIERCEEFPADPRLQRLAMMSAVHYGVDPIWMRTGLGLTRWGTNVPMGDLEKVNPNWVRFVRSLNRSLRERPPLWLNDTHE